MSTKRAIHKLGVALLTFAGAMASANAVQIYFVDRAAFEAAAGSSLSLQSFETSFATSASQSFPGFTFSETGGTNLVGHYPTVNPGGFNPNTLGTGAMWFDDNGDSIGTFVFGPGISAFGVDVTTSDPATVLIGGDVSFALALGDNMPGFFGVIDTGGTFSTVTFNASGGPNIGWDYVQFGIAQIPEPTALALLGLALAGLGFSRRQVAR